MDCMDGDEHDSVTHFGLHEVHQRSLPLLDVVLAASMSLDSDPAQEAVEKAALVWPALLLPGELQVILRFPQSPIPEQPGLTHFSFIRHAPPAEGSVHINSITGDILLNVTE